MFATLLFISGPRTRTLRTGEYVGGTGGARGSLAREMGGAGVCGAVCWVPSAWAGGSLSFGAAGDKYPLYYKSARQTNAARLFSAVKTRPD